MNAESSPSDGSQKGSEPASPASNLTPPTPPPSFPEAQDHWLERHHSLSDLFTNIPWRKLLSLIIDSNPFFLLSALFMLQGIYLVSVDPQMLGQEQSQLAFNFSSLQIYELLLVLTALFLSRRLLLHDTALLFWLENMFVFIPFILISQASMMENRAVWTGSLCAAATIFTALRFSSLKLYLRPMQLPSTALVLGAVLLLTNLTLPLHFRSVIGEDSQAWTELSPLLWRWFMPVLFLSLFAFPMGKNLMTRSYAQRWTPYAAAILWILATTAHLRSVDYLDGIRFRIAVLAPMLCAFAWVFNLRLTHFLQNPETWRTRTLILPVLATIPAIQYGTGLFLALTAINCVVFGWQALMQRNETAREFLLASLTALIAAIPHNLGYRFIPDFSREKIILLSIGAYLFVQACRARTPRGAIAGAMIVGFASQYLFEHFDYVEQLALQNALLFGLAHSLFWTGERTTFSNALWKAFAIALPLHSFRWGTIAGLDAALMITLASLFIVAVYVLARQFQGHWATKALPVAAAVNVSTIAINHAIEVLRITPTGYLVVLGAFLFFASGIAYALTRDRWHKGNVVGNNLPLNPLPANR
jgi:hypothetical protein